MTTKPKRLDTIRDLLRRNDVSNQSQLLSLLAVEGIDTTQATLSRDLRELGVVKEQDNYSLPADGVQPAIDLGPIAKKLRDAIARVDRSGTLVVLHLNVREAETYAELVESAKFIQVVGAVGSGKTVLVATRSIGEASHLASHFRSLVI